jgi:hypothetical protein
LVALGGLGGLGSRIGFCEGEGIMDSLPLTKMYVDVKPVDGYRNRARIMGSRIELIINNYIGGNIVL